MTNQINTVLEDVELANRLLRYGKREQDIEAIELAAKILQDSIYMISQEMSESDATSVMPDRKELEPASAGEMIARDAGGGGKIGVNQWAEIQPGQTVTLDPHPLFAKKSKASVQVKSDARAKLFIYWRRVDLVSDPDDFAVGQGSASAKWRTGIAKKKWEVQVENRRGPACKIHVTTNAVG